MPNPARYPWQWLWDSCFHSVVWAHLGDERAVAELERALSPIDADGFVPHVRYAGAPSPHADLWGRSATSSISQPPMFGHALAEIVRCGMELPEAVLEAATTGMRFWLRRRRRSPGGLVELVHPWESGCDDSPRWDDLLGPREPGAWFRRKGELMASVERSAGGAPLANPAFPVASAGFNALVAFNAAELAGLTGDADLAGAAGELGEALDARWDPERATWVDDGPTAGGSGRIRTLDGLLGVLVSSRHAGAALESLTDGAAHGAPFGPTGVHRAEAGFEPRTYWRGSAWPQLNYLCWVAGVRSSEPSGSSVAAALRRSMVAGAATSGFAEHWDPDSGEPLGAVPQSWSTLALVSATSR